MLLKTSCSPYNLVPKGVQSLSKNRGSGMVIELFLPDFSDDTWFLSRIIFHCLTTKGGYPSTSQDQVFLKCRAKCFLNGNVSSALFFIPLPLNPTQIPKSIYHFQQFSRPCNPLALLVVLSLQQTLYNWLPCPGHMEVHPWIFPSTYVSAAQSHINQVCWRPTRIRSHGRERPTASDGVCSCCRSRAFY